MLSQERNKAEVVRRTGYAFSAISNLIENHDVIAFDVSKTLLSRCVLSSDGVFRFMEQSLGVEGFCGARLKAEQLAERRFGTNEASEISLNEIYSLLAVLLPDSTVTPDDERKCEEKFHFSNQAFVMIAAVAREKGKRLIGINDTQMNKDQVSRLLEALGIELDALYSPLDGHHFLLKAAANEEAAPNRALHFSQRKPTNMNEDVDSSITAIHVIQHSDCLWQDDAPFVDQGRGEYTFTSDLILGQIAARLPHVDPEEPDLYSCGFNVCGPLLLGFCDYIAEHSMQDGFYELLLPPGQIHIIEQSLSTLKLPLSCYSISDVKEVITSDFSNVSAEKRKQLRHRIEAWKSQDSKNIAIVDVDGSVLDFDFLTSPQVHRYCIFDQSSPVRQERASAYLLDGANATNTDVSVIVGTVLFDLLFANPKASFPNLNSKKDISLTLNGKAEAITDVGLLASICVQRGALDFLRMIAPIKDTLDRRELKDFNYFCLTRLVTTPTEREYRTFENVPFPWCKGETEWRTIESYWKPESISSKYLTDFRRQIHEQQLHNYDRMLPNSIKDLSMRDDIGQLDWRRIMYRHPLKISYWNSVRRFQRQKQNELGQK
ncbi:hypothetical protein [Ruegeria sp. Alg231-54]|uniref:hypothetical protein n=1 Tax=Ruegeria sp. Alg231-54 TaxID=1922221 RepID=UPI000D557877|nr:hypothetical protein [Ruegeria sp. Alg231-54]